MNKLFLLNLLSLSLLAACATPSPTPTASPSAPAVRPENQPSAAPVTPAGPLRFEIETATKTKGDEFPKPERRGQKGAIVMVFSGGDANSGAEMDLPPLSGRYHVKVSYYNHPDSPEMTIKLGGQSLTLPAGFNGMSSNGEMVTQDLGQFSLSAGAGAKLQLSVGGNKVGMENAWIGIDYIELTP